MKLSVLGVAVAVFLLEVNAKSKLQIHIPTEFHRADGYDHQEALFGIPPYGGSIQQQLYYADSNLCDANVDTRGGFPKREVDSSGQQRPWDSPFLLMVDRGGDCTFVTKVRNAQRAGAAGVIFADTWCLCQFIDVCKSDDPNISCDYDEPAMADDGSGGDISIPSVLMFKQDADPIKEALKSGMFVRMEMSWTLPSAEQVEYSLWSVPSDPIAQPFEQQFGDAAALLGDKAKFTPHFNINNGLDIGCDKIGCLGLCTNKGRYCSGSPYGDLTKEASGADVVTESLRRLCIWDLYGGDGIGMPWWNYVKIFTSQCSQPEDEGRIYSQGCIKDAMEKAGVSWEKVERCMNDSGGLTENRPNVFLEKELFAKASLGVVTWPAVFVNGAPVQGAPSNFDVVLKAVCAGYSASSDKPQVCDQCPSCSTRMGGEYECVKAGGVCGGANEPFASSGTSSSGKSSSSIGPHGNIVVVSSIVIVVVLSAGMAYFLHRRSQRQVRDQVLEMVAEYMPLDEDSRSTGQSRSV